MLRDSDIIIFSLSRWDAPISSPSFSLAKEFARGNRVFYIDHPFSVKDFVTSFNSSQIRKRKSALLWGKDIYTKDPAFPEKLTMVAPRLTLPINFLPVSRIYNTLARRNEAIVFNTVRQVIKDFSVGEFVFFNAFDPYFCRNFPDDIKPLLKVYQSMDDITQAEYTSRHGARLEEEIIRNFDITLTTSQELRRLKSKLSDHVYYHPNAADFSNFRRALSEKFPRPAELEAAEGKKVIGYTGNIETRIDYALLKQVLEYHSDKMLVMVGPITSSDARDSGLAELPNVIMTGPRKIVELPAYLQYFDCTLIPFKKNTLTRSIYPLKINEYLAAGRPVVTTDFSEDIQGFSDVAYVGRDADEFVQLIDRAIAENNSERIEARLAVANTNTWTARVEQFWEILESHCMEKKYFPLSLFWHIYFLSVI